MLTKSVFRFLACSALTLLVACQPTLEDHLAEAQALIDAGQPRFAIDRLRPIVRENPDHPEASYLLGVAFASAGEWGRALWPLDRARRSEPFEQLANRWLGWVLLEQGDPRAALQAAEQALRLDANDELASGIRYQAMISTGDCERILSEIPEAPLATGTDQQARATALECAGRADEALVAWRKLRQRARREASGQSRSIACLNVARLLSKNAQPTEANEVLKSCLEAYSSPALRAQVAEQYRANERLSEAEETLRDGLTEFPGHPQLADGLAALLDARGDSDSALEVLEAAAEFRPSPASWIKVAQYARIHSDLQRARQSLESAIDANPKEADSARFALIDLLIMTEEYPQARLHAEQLEDDAMRALVDGTILLKEGDAEGALRQLDAGLAQWPGNAGARFMAGEAARSLGQRERAMADYRAALRADLSVTLAAERLADLLIEDGEMREALSVLANRFEYSAGSAPDSPHRQNLAYRAGRIALDLDEVSLAIQWLERCLELEPMHLSAANDLAWLFASQARELPRALELARQANNESPSEETRDTLDFVERQLAEHGASNRSGHPVKKKEETHP